jgi:inactivated superfamily I helicase
MLKQHTTATMASQPNTIAQQCEAAMARIRASINRSAGQHLRAMKAASAERAALAASVGKTLGSGQKVGAA